MGSKSKTRTSLGDIGSGDIGSPNYTAASGGSGDIGSPDYTAASGGSGDIGSGDIGSPDLELGMAFAKGGPVMAKGHRPHDIAYAAGGPVLGRSRSFLKEPDQFTGGRKTQPETASVKQDYGTKDAPAGKDKSLSPVKPRG